MPKLSLQPRKKAALPPGTLVHVGEKKIEKARIRIIDYDEEQLREREAEKIEECFPFKDEQSSTWINIDGLHEVELIEKLGIHFGIHPLVLEDILNTTHRPKFEDGDSYLFIVLKMLYYDGDDDEILDEQLSIVLGNNFVISFQERVGDVFEPVRERIRSGKIRIRKRKSDHIAFALIDAVVDNYSFVLEKLGEKLENFEDELLENPPDDVPQQILAFKRKILALRRTIYPLREAIEDLQSCESDLLTETTLLYLKDVYDHVTQAIDVIDGFREMVSGMLETYHSSISNRMNEVMKVLTIIATIFIPLTFIAGIYGMNFEHMPELGWIWAYPIAFWAIILGLGGFMVYLFKRKKWL